MTGNPMFGILLLAVVAGVILFRLYAVLGRRTGNERPPRDSYRLGNIGQQTAPSAEQASTGNVVLLPDRSQATSGKIAADPASPAAQGLIDIKLADRKFETDHFISGARGAYEMIVSAFAAGDRAALKPLLSEEVYNAFEGTIRAREEQHEKIEFTFVGFNDVTVTHAELKDRLAEITVSFAAKYISTTTDIAGKILGGDPKAVREVIDIWTFGRQIDARDPNWILVATSGPMP